MGKWVRGIVTRGKEGLRKSEWRYGICKKTGGVKKGVKDMCEKGYKIRLIIESQKR